MTIRVDKNSGEVFLYGVVGEIYDGEGFGTVEVLDALAALGGKRATVRINSPGGYASDGVAIYNALKRYSGGVDTVVDAVAASAASIIALAGEKRITSRGGRWMIHRAMCFAVGNVSDMQNAINALANCDQSLVDIYQTCMPGTPEEIMSLLEAETWYTGETAMISGLSTSIGDQTTAKPKIAAWFKNAPAALLTEVKNSGQLASVKAKALALATNSVKIKAPSKQEFALGDRVKVRSGEEHDEMTMGKSGIVKVVSSSALGIKFDGTSDVHKWYVSDELEKA